MAPSCGLEERIGRLICRERCAAYGDPPCYNVVSGAELNCGGPTSDPEELTCAQIGRLAASVIADDGK